MEKSGAIYNNNTIAYITSSISEDSVRNSFFQNGKDSTIFWFPKIPTLLYSNRTISKTKWDQQKNHLKIVYITTLWSVVGFLQQRLAAVRLTWGAKGMIILFLVFGLIFAVLSIPLFIVANSVSVFLLSVIS